MHTEVLRFFLCTSNAILVTKYFYRYSTIINSAKTFSTKVGGRFSNVLEIKCTKLYSDLFRCEISIVRCLRGYFLDTVHVKC